MREIKFRAWDIERKFYEEIGNFYWFEENGVRDQDEDGTFEGHHGHYVVEQFTGLKDKNGREIYEGDFVKASEDTVQVLWSKKYASFCLHRVGWAFFHFFAEAVEAHRCEVIGNIHENPELLK